VDVAPARSLGIARADFLRRQCGHFLRRRPLTRATLDWLIAI